jgi:hypothetical protein
MFKNKLLIVFAILLGGIFYVTSGNVGWGDDVIWHTLNGLDILRQHHIITQDIWTWKTYGLPWADTEWLWDVILGFLYSHFGWMSVHLLQTVLGVILMLILFKYSEHKDQDSYFAMAFGTLTALMISLWFCARPQGLSFVLFALGMWMFEKYRDQHWSKILLFLPFFVLWNNVHGTSILFLGLLGIEILFNFKFWKAIPFYILALLVRPNTIQSLFFAIVQQTNPIMSYMGERQPPNVHNAWGIMIFEFGILTYFMIRTTLSKREKIELFFGWFALLFGTRFFPYTVIISWFVVINHWDIQTVSFKKVVMTISIVLAFMNFWFYQTPFSNPPTLKAAQYCAEHGVKRVVNQLGVGKSLEWYGIQPMTDDRTLVAGQKDQEWYTDYIHMLVGTYPLKNFLQEQAQNINTALWVDDTAPALQMSLMPEWTKVYDDHKVSIWQKKEATF